ncbi:hypothetical protein P171DRAFT_516288 [Karstenula rhodostoma CBS 690.94]|uniref:Rhodopsin domain-containing protein n=1 Tax=Karstenula rhodostoma CBS 690.94 TaxID=1392251 RepID=A0A9P4PW29_9PLEO|nr:hypothetical protein P171DRAFT_516288 [Karstenula rhodostoma CBS 690.94]
MRWIDFFARCALLAPMLVGAVQVDVAPRKTVDIPDCIRQCEDVRARKETCWEQIDQGKVTCECRTTLTEPAVVACYQMACKPKEIFATLNTVATACHDPRREKSKTYRTTIIAFFALATISMIVRYATHFTVGKFNILDSVNIGVGYLLNVVLFACCIRMSFLALGRDMWTVDDAMITTTLRYFWVSEYVYFAAIGFVKTSFLIFFLQIFPLKSFRKIVWACIVFNLTATFACTIAAIFVCRPISFAWTQWDGEHQGKCVSNNNLAFAHAGMGIVMDFITLVLPISQIWSLHMSVKKKIGVLLMFSVGAVVTIVSILRLRSLMNFAKTQNMTWDYLEASLWSFIETEVGLICACMPSIRLCLARAFPKIMGSSVHSSSKQTGGNNSHGNTLNTNWSHNAIGVTTSVRVSHAMRPQINDEASFVQLVEIDGDQKSAKSNRSADG